MGEFIRDQLPDPATYYSDQGLALQGVGKWRTTECRFHGGSDSMRVHIQTGGFVCMNCNAKGGDILSYQRAAHGQDFVTAAKALNAFREDGRPVKVQRPKPLPATAAIQVLAFESTLAAIAAGNIANGVVLTEIDRARLLVAARRINHVAEIFA